MSALDYIIINNVSIPRPPMFAPEREDIYKGDYTTCTGKVIADLVGWKYADMTLHWDAMTQTYINTLVGMSGACTLQFDDADGTTHTETVVRTSVVSRRHKFTQNGVTIWRDVNVTIKFINSHTGG